MIASELIVENLLPLAHTDGLQRALWLMDEFKIRHYPVLKNGNFVGIISEEDVLERFDEHQTLDELFDHLPRPKVWEHDHVYEVVAKMGEFQLSAIPILSQDEHYLGCTTVHWVVQILASSTALQESGGIIVLEMNQNDYSMTQIAQIVESNQAKIISSSFVNVPNSTKIELTLKINELDIERIVLTFLRFDYTVKSTHQKSEFAEDLQYRFDSLMHFMNV